MARTGASWRSRLASRSCWPRHGGVNLSLRSRSPAGVCWAMPDTRRDSDDESLYADFLPENCDHRLRELYEYWRSRHPAEGVLPGRQHFDPVDVPKLLPWIWLVD